MQGCSLHLLYINLLQALTHHRPFWFGHCLEAPKLRGDGNAGAQATPETAWATGIFQHHGIFAHAHHCTARHHAAFCKYRPYGKTSCAHSTSAANWLQACSPGLGLGATQHTPRVPMRSKTPYLSSVVLGPSVFHLCLQSASCESTPTPCCCRFFSGAPRTLQTLAHLRYSSQPKMNGFPFSMCIWRSVRLLLRLPLSTTDDSGPSTLERLLSPRCTGTIET